MAEYKEEFHRIIHKLKTRLIEFYNGRLISIVLFGSVGRDEFSSDSDIDLLIIINDIPSGRSKRFFEYYENVYIHVEKDICDLSKRGINIVISPVIKSREEVHYGNPIFIDMTEKCKILFDENNFFRSVLKELQVKMQNYKSRKIFLNGKYYWKLKRDYRWGDEIKL